MQTGLTKVSKGAFAAMLNVSPGRVSQYIAAGKIHGPAIEGEGRSAVIVVEIACQQLEKSLDMVQRLAQSTASQPPLHFAPPQPDAVHGDALQVPPPPPPVMASPAAPVDPDTALYNRSRAENAAIQTERSRRDLEADRGRYVLKASVEPGFSRVLTSIILSLEQSLTDIGSAMAAELALDEKKITLALRAAYRSWRADMAAEARKHGMSLPAYEPDPEREPPPSSPEASDPE